jgi:hypothetical protein
MREFPPRYDFRLEDLRAWHLVEAFCRHCRHRATVAHESLMRGRPAFTRLSDLERALRSALRHPGAGITCGPAAGPGLTARPRSELLQI